MACESSKYRLVSHLPFGKLNTGLLKEFVTKSTRTDKATRCSILEIIVLREQRDDLGENWLAHELSFMVL